MSDFARMISRAAGTAASAPAETARLRAANDDLNTGFTSLITKLHKLGVGVTLSIPTVANHVDTVTASAPTSGLNEVILRAPGSTLRISSPSLKM